LKKNVWQQERKKGATVIFDIFLAEQLLKLFGFLIEQVNAF